MLWLLEHLEHAYRLLTSSDVLLLRIRKCPETQSLQSILLDQDLGLRRNEVRMTNVYKLWQGTSMGGIPSNLLDPFVSLPNTESPSLASLLSVKFLGCPIINTKINPREIGRMRSHLLSGVDAVTRQNWYSSQLAVVYFFRAGILFSIKNAKFWLILANFGYFVANVRAFWCTFYRPW